MPFCLHIQENPHLTGLRITHPVTIQEKFDISLLIGADHYRDIVEDEVIRGGGPTAVASKLGYLLSGPLQTSYQNHYKPPMSAPLPLLSIYCKHCRLPRKKRLISNINKYFRCYSRPVILLDSCLLNFKQSETLLHKI